jgi:tRNA-uridine 2-sulfurtransferase
MANLPMVVVAMSGGVDSSVAAALLVEQGYAVVGMMLRLWSEEGHEGENRCCTPDAMAQARRVAAILGIPFYALDVRERFRGSVVQAFLDGYARGQTPNPCIVCNRFIRWGYLMEQAQQAGAEYMATGHYARLRRTPGGQTELLRARDGQKDQSYVLSSLNQAQLAHTLLPLGELNKPEVRELARKFGLPVAERPDSQDLCFLGHEDYRTFLGRHSPEAARPGPIVNLEGQVVGTHQGLAFYTIGQRKGLGIAAPQPYYVFSKDLEQNRLVVGQSAQLGQQEMTVGAMNWILGDAPASEFQAEVKIRYKSIPAPARVIPLEVGKVHVAFDQPARDITPGQLAVFYQGELVTGSGLIES